MGMRLHIYSTCYMKHSILGSLVLDSVVQVAGENAIPNALLLLVLWDCCFIVVLPEVTVEFSSPVYEVVEGERVEVTVELRGKTDIDVVVIIATQDSTANGETIKYYCALDMVILFLSLSLSSPSPANKDYTSINKTLTFSSSISTHNISINTINDNILEDKELFQLLLSQPQQANDGVILTDTIATNVTILDNDCKFII